MVLPADILRAHGVCVFGPLPGNQNILDHCGAPRSRECTIPTSPRNQSAFAHVLARSSCPDLEVLELGKHAERFCVSGHPFGKHRDPILVHVAEESPGLCYMENEEIGRAHV